MTLILADFEAKKYYPGYNRKKLVSIFVKETTYSCLRLMKVSNKFINFDFLKEIFETYKKPREIRPECFLLACENHQFIAYANRDGKYISKSTGKDEVCRFCVAVKFAINDRLTKVFTTKHERQNFAFRYFLIERFFPCELLFFKTNLFASIFVDNPLEKYIFSKQTD